MASKLILLVEDNEDDVGLTLRAMRKNQVDYQVEVVNDGVEALDYLGKAFDAGRLPDLILLDLKLPRMGGLQFLRQLRGTPFGRILPVVILTSSKEEQDLIDSYSLGANSYIRKPIDFSEFVEVVRQMGLYWLTLNESPPIMR